MKRLIVIATVLTALTGCAGDQIAANGKSHWDNFNDSIQRARVAAQPNVPFPNSTRCTTQQYGNQYVTNCS